MGWGFAFLGVASSRWYIIENMQVLSFYRAFWGMVGNIFLNLMLIPEYGIRGAAFASLVGQFLAAFLFDIFHSKTKIIFFMKLRSLFMIKEIKCLTGFISRM